MNDSVVLLVLTVVMVWWSTPRLFRICDTRLARLNIAALQGHTTVSSVHLITETPIIESSLTTLADLASLCDSLARATRGGASPAVAMNTCVDRHRLTGAHWSQLLHGESSSDQFSDTVSMAFQRAHDNHAEDDARCL